MDSFIKGAFAGGFAVGCTYPLDTIKTRLQCNTMPRAELFRNLFSGIGAPMTAVMLEKSLLFSAFESLKHIQWTNRDTANNFINGVNAGLLTTFVVTPFERVKIRAQNNHAFESKDAALDIMRTEGIRGFGRGWTATLCREVPGYGFYFATLTYCQKKWPCNPDTTSTVFYQNLAKQWFIGGVTGLVPWIFIYPSDIVKTTMQHRNWPLVKSSKHIYREGGLRAFYKGYYVGLVRAFFLHSFVILGYHLADLMYSKLKPEYS